MAHSPAPPERPRPARPGPRLGAGRTRHDLVEERQRLGTRLPYAAAFHHQHGHLAVPAAAKLDDYAVGAWMRRQRKADNLTTDQVPSSTAWTSCGAWSRTGTAPTADCSPTSPPAAPSTAPPTVPASATTRPSGLARGCASRTGPAPRAS
ncbi:helicase associated domain-containing protein [Kitasatospora sp. NPDC059146]|uniref:helicase associated domain-containing protein n=1 Tax=Kitasatospora sp. NPDC059146 TaxID=3346741 RepID=UPI003678A61E